MKSKVSVNISKRDFMKKYGALCALALLLLINIAVTPNFLKASTFINLGTQSFSVILVSIGMALVIGVGGIDISAGSTMAVTAVVCCLLIDRGSSIVLAAAAAFGTAAVIGLFNGFLITKFKIQPIIVTLIFYIAGRGIAQVLNNGQTISFYDNGFTDLGLFRIADIPIQVYIALAAAVLFLFITHKTSFGFQIQAAGDNVRTARLSGIHTQKITIAAYVIMALLCCLGAIVDSSRIGSADPNSLGDSIEIDAIAAVAIGGTSLNGGKIYMIGAVLGAVLMQLITVTINMNNIEHAYSLVVKAAVIIAAVYLQRDKKNR